MLNYEFFKNFWKKNNLSENEIVSSKIYKFLITSDKLSCKFVKGDNLFIANLTSFCSKYDPDKLRIRSDKFLNLVKQNKHAGLLVGIHYKSKKYFLFFSSKAFFGYDSSCSQSNSFITFSHYDFVDNYFIIEHDSVHKKKSKLLKKMNEYFFYISVDEKFNSDYFILFDREISNSVSCPSSKIIIKNFSVPVSNKITYEVRNSYNFLCGLVSRYYFNFRCPCREIDVNFLKLNDLNYTDLHHFAPKKLLILEFEKQNKVINWNIIHAKVNLIPLCQACHLGIHKGKSNTELVTKIFNSIINLYKINNQYDLFVEYLSKNFNLSLENLLKYYLNQNEEDDDE